MAHRIVGIDIGPDSIKATFAETSFRSFKIVECREFPIPSPDEYASIQLEGEPSSVESQTDFPPPETIEDNGETEAVEEEEIEPIPGYVFGLAKMLKAPGVHFNEAAVAIPSSLISNHIIELPFTDAKKIDQIIPIEIENYVPFDLDVMIHSHQVISKTDNSSKVLVSLVKNDDLATFLENINAAGLDPAIVDVGPNALVNAAAPMDFEASGGIMLLDVGAIQSDMSILQDGKLIAIRSIPIGSNSLSLESEKALTPLIQRLRQTIQKTLVQHNLAIRKILVSGPFAANRKLDEMLAQSLDIEVAPYAPFDADFEKGVPDDDRTNAIYAKSLGLAFRLTHLIKGKQINLRKGDYVYKRAGGFLRTEIKKFAIMGGILILLLGYNLVYAHMLDRREAENIRAQISKVFLETFPGERVVNPVEQFRQNMELVYKKYKIVGYLGEGDMSAIDVLKHLSESIPKTVKLDIKKLDLTQDKLYFEGVTDNFEQVDKIETALKTFPGFKEVKKESSTRTANEAIKFKFNIKLTDKEEAGSMTGRRQAILGGG